MSYHCQNRALFSGNRGSKIAILRNNLPKAVCTVRLLFYDFFYKFLMPKRPISDVFSRERQEEIK